MAAVTDLVHDAFRTEERGIDWASGLAGAAAGIGPLAIGLAIDESAAGLIAGLGGLNTALCVPRADPAARAWWGSICALGGAGAIAVGDAGSGDVSLAVLSGVWVLLWALLRAAGKSGALTGFAVSAMFVIYAGIPVTAPRVDRLGWYALGAFPGLALMVAARRGPPGSVVAGRASLLAVRDAARRDRALQAHAARLGLTIGGGTLLYRLAGLPHGYWVPMTILTVLQPTVHATRVRGLQRTAGTLIAAAVIVAITFATDARWPLLACAAVSAFFLYAIQERGYFWIVVLITPTALLMLSAVDFQGDTVAFDRVADSMLGILIGVAVGELAALLGEATGWFRSSRGVVGSS